MDDLDYLEDQYVFKGKNNYTYQFLVQGLKGSKGMIGEPGRDIISGQNGLKGSKGMKGEQGPPGQPGPNGMDGADGVRGVFGNKGSPGEAGIEGLKVFI